MKAFGLTINLREDPQIIEKYKEYHRNVWPEVEQALKNNIEEIIDADPRIRATAIVITPFESGIQIEVELEYIKYNISERLKLTFDQKNGLIN